MSEWIDISIEDFDLTVPAESSGGCHTFVSPYDVPRSFMATKNRKAFRVDFQYIGDEPRKAIKREGTVEGVGHAILVVGQNSGRLYSIIVALGKSGCDNITKIVNDAVDVLCKNPYEALRTHNYRLVSETIIRHGESIFSSCGTAAQ